MNDAYISRLETGIVRSEEGQPVRGCPLKNIFYVTTLDGAPLSVVIEGQQIWASKDHKDWQQVVAMSPA